MPNTFSPSFPATTDQFVGFVVFWFLSTPFLWLRPEKFKIPFLVVCIWCGVGMLAWMIWAVVTAKGVGPLWNAGQTIPSGSPWGTSWLIMAGINQTIGGLAAGITNGSDFSRYARSRRHYIHGTIASCVITNVVVSLVGLVTTASGQKIYGEIYWNPTGTAHRGPVRVYSFWLQVLPSLQCSKTYAVTLSLVELTLLVSFRVTSTYVAVPLSRLWLHGSSSHGNSSIVPPLSSLSCRPSLYFWRL